jgi:hypothetical protein
MPENYNRPYPQRPNRRPENHYSQYNDPRRGRFSYRHEDPRDYYTPTGRDIYVEDENISGRMTPMGYDYRDDGYDYEFDANGPDWQYDSDNDYGLYSPDRVWDYAGHGASGYAGPYWGRPTSFAERQNRMFHHAPGRYGRQPVYPLNFGNRSPQWPEPRYRNTQYGNRYTEPRYDRNGFEPMPHERQYYRRPKGRY